MGRTWRPRSLHPTPARKQPSPRDGQTRPRKAGRGPALPVHTPAGSTPLAEATGTSVAPRDRRGRGNAEASGERGTCRGKDRFLVQPLTPHVRDRRHCRDRGGSQASTDSRLVNSWGGTMCPTAPDFSGDQRTLLASGI